MAKTNNKSVTNKLVATSFKYRQTQVSKNDQDPFFKDLMNYANEPSRIWNEHIKYCKQNNIKINGWGLIED